MKSVCALLALWVAGSTLSASVIESPRPSASDHRCCCPSCPGSGICPCDLGAGGEDACVRSTDDVPKRAISVPGLHDLKLTCEVPLLEEGSQAERLPSVDPRPPSLPLDPQTLEKVPIRPR